MAYLEVLEARRVEPDFAAVWGGNVDHPKSGDTTLRDDVEIDGWVLARHSPVSAVEIVSDGEVLGRTPLYELRPDVASVYPEVANAERSGFRIELAVPARPTIHVNVQAVLQDGTRLEIGELSFRRRWRQARDQAYRELVSVVVPCFNQAHLLGEAIESLLAQTHENIEILVVDDGSDDNTAAVVARYPTVRYVRQDNAGAPAARNAGLRSSNGDLLVFLDADDVLLPDAIETGVHALQEHPEAAFVFGYTTILMEDGKEPPPTHQPTFENDYYSRLLAGCPIVSGSSIVYRRSIFEAVGPFDPTLSNLEDYDFYYRVARQFPIHCHRRVVAVYRQHGMNTTAVVRPTALRDAAKVFARQRAYARRDPELWHAYLTGRRKWLGHIGRLLARTVQEDFASRRCLRGVEGISALLRWWPRGLVALIRAPRRRVPIPTWTPEG